MPPKTTNTNKDSTTSQNTPDTTSSKHVECSLNNEKVGKIPKFSGKPEDYKLWTFKFEAYLIDIDYEDMLELADNAIKGQLNTLESLDDTQIKKNKKFYAKIVRAVDNITARKLQLLDGRDGIKAWEQIYKYNKRKDDLILDKTEDEYHKLKLESGQDPLEYILQVEEMALKLKEMGAPLSQKRIAAKLLRGLPAEYENFKTSNINLTNDLEKLKEEIQIHYLHIISPKLQTDGIPSEIANHLMDQNKRHPRGRGRRNLHGYKNQGRGNRGRGRGINIQGKGRANNGVRQHSEKPAFKKGKDCYNCGKEGHYARDCFAKGGGKEGQYQKKKEESNQIIDQEDGAFHVEEILEPNQVAKEEEEFSPLDSSDEETNDEYYSYDHRSDHPYSDLRDDNNECNLSNHKIHNIKQVSEYNEERFTENAFLATHSTNTIRLYIDSACTRHMIKDKELFRSLSKDNRNINTAFGVGRAKGIGKVILKLKGEDSSILHVTATDTLYIPSIPKNLLCSAMLLDRGNEIDLTNQVLKLNRGKRIPIYREGNLYYIEVIKPQEETHNATMNAGDEIMLWHNRLGHINYISLRDIPNRVKGVSFKENQDIQICDTCVLTKSKKKKFAKFKEPAARPLDLVVTDLSGRIDIKSARGNEYVSGFVDSYSRYTMVYPIKTKDEAIKTIDKMRQEVSDVGAVKRLLSDLGGEYTSNELIEYCLKHSIKHEFVPKETPEQVGLIERRWGVLFAIVRALLKWAKLPYRFWDYAVETAAYILNRTLTNGNVEKLTPHELFTEKIPYLGDMRTFGCICYVHQFPSQRDSAKLSDRARKGIFLGYGITVKGYRVYIPGKREIVISRHVDFDESSPGGSLLKEESVCESMSISKQPLELFRSNKKGVHQKTSNESEQMRSNPLSQIEELDTKRSTEHETLERSRLYQEIISENNEASLKARNELKSLTPWHFDKRKKAPKENSKTCHKHNNHPTFHNYNMTLRNGKTINSEDSSSNTEDMNSTLYDIEEEYAYLSKQGEPWTYQEAINREDSYKWKVAMDEEIEQLEKKQTWKWVPLPKDRKAISSKWVYKIKENADGSIERYKARLVARGFSQEYGIDYSETFAPVVRSTTKRIMMAIAATEGWKLKQLDIKSAFVNATVTEDIYMKPPEGMKVKKDKDGNVLYLKLQRALYGLKQAGRNWYENLVQWLLSQKFIRSKVDPCLFVRSRNKTNGYLAISCYVDDLDALVEKDSDYQEFLEELKRKYEISDLGDLDWSLGINVHQQNGQVKINQEKYINDMLSKYNMRDCKEQSVPALESKLTKNDSPENGSINQVEMKKKPYRNLVGSLLYSAIWTRPDITYAVSACSRYLENPGEAHWIAAKRILRYLKGTKSLGIEFNYSRGLELYGYCDADWASDLDSRRSTTGYVFILAGGSISWKVKVQPTVALSSAEAEYMALSAATQEAIYLRNLMKDLGYELKEATTLFQDNQACISMAKNPTNHQRRKHIDIKYHFINEAIENHQIRIVYCKSEDMHADIFTKPLSKTKFQRHRSVIMN